jgi:hypothetical protein
MQNSVRTIQITLLFVSLLFSVQCYDIYMYNGAQQCRAVQESECLICEEYISIQIICNSTSFTGSVSPCSEYIFTNTKCEGQAAYVEPVVYEESPCSFLTSLNLPSCSFAVQIPQIIQEPYSSVLLSSLSSAYSESSSYMTLNAQNTILMFLFFFTGLSCFCIGGILVAAILYVRRRQN